jgi:hypothetical protein
MQSIARRDVIALEVGGSGGDLNSQQPVVCKDLGAANLPAPFENANAALSMGRRFVLGGFRLDRLLEFAVGFEFGRGQSGNVPLKRLHNYQEVIATLAGLNLACRNEVVDFRHPLANHVCSGAPADCDGLK